MNGQVVDKIIKALEDTEQLTKYLPWREEGQDPAGMLGMLAQVL